MRSQTPLAFLSLLVLIALPLGAQARRGRSRYNHEDAIHTVSAGVYVTGGISHASQPLSGVSGLQGQVGAYAEYARHKLRPGVDARLAGELYSIGNFWGGSNPGGSAGQKLIGPRISYAVGIFHPYVEGLFGVGHQNDTPQSNFYTANNGTTLNSTGTAKFGTVGCDFAAHNHIHVRAEYSAGSINDHGYTIQNFTTGLVFRFP